MVVGCGCRAALLSCRTDCIHEKKRGSRRRRRRGRRKKSPLGSKTISYGFSVRCVCISYTCTAHNSQAHVHFYYWIAHHSRDRLCSKSRPQHAHSSRAAKKTAALLFVMYILFVIPIHVCLPPTTRLLALKIVYNFIT